MKGLTKLRAIKAGAFQKCYSFFKRGTSYTQDIYGSYRLRHGGDYGPLETVELPEGFARTEAPALPEMSETDISRHYSELCRKVHGVNCGFYPLGSCTMKYNPRVNEEAAAQPGFTQLHPLQPVETVQGALEVLATAERLLCEITGMDLSLIHI